MEKYLTNKLGKSQFVTRAIARAFDEKKKRTRERALAKKYRSFANEASRTDKEWFTIDFEFGKLRIIG